MHTRICPNIHFCKQILFSTIFSTIFSIIFQLFFNYFSTSKQLALSWTGGLPASAGQVGRKAARRSLDGRMPKIIILTIKSNKGRSTPEPPARNRKSNLRPTRPAEAGKPCGRPRTAGGSKSLSRPKAHGRPQIQNQ